MTFDFIAYLRRARWPAMLASAMLVSACGGGGGGDSTPTNRVPVANPGADRNVAENFQVILDGSGSFDADGTIVAYAWSQVAGPDVTLSGANTATASFLAPDITVPTLLTFQLLVTDDDGAISAPQTVNLTVVVPGATVLVSGQITFDLVPHTASGALDYNNIVRTPAPLVRVQAIEVGTQALLDETSADESGNYSLTVPSLTDIYVQARAQMLSVGANSWNFSVVDNNGQPPPLQGPTPVYPVYALVSDNFNSDINDWSVNLHGATVWNGTSYTVRNGAPFSILYAVNKAVQLLLSADPLVSFPSLKLNWSVNNNFAAIGTSFYNGEDIYLLGGVNEDTEEYDHSVIVHEWGHYFEDVFSRADSVGGNHFLGDLLDLRVAFGEGWGNAFQSMALGNPVYSDSNGTSQSRSFSFNVDGNCLETNRTGTRGWFNECSVQSILYDLFDATGGLDGAGGENVEMGFGPIYDVLVFDQPATPALTSIFSFASYLREFNPADQAGIDGLLGAQSIVNGPSLDIWASNETNDGGTRLANLGTNVLPIYDTRLVPNGGAVNVCVDVDLNEGDFNKPGNRYFFRFTVPGGSYNIIATNTQVPAGFTGTPDPDMALYASGLRNLAIGAPAVTERFCDGGFDTGPCTGGALQLLGGQEYVLEVTDDHNISYDLDPAVVGLYCMDVALVSQ